METTTTLEQVKPEETNIFNILEQQRQDSLEFVSKPWVNFFKKFSEIESMQVSKWKPLHQLAYFDKRFRDHFKKNFVYTLNGAPSKCKEIVLIKKIYAMLATNSSKIVKEYIDWVFDSKIIPKNMTIRTLAYFLTSDIGNEFYACKKEKERITRSKELPEQFKNIINEFDIPASTYGELAFIKDALDKNFNIGNVDKYKDMLFKLESYGFDVNTLTNLD